MVVNQAKINIVDNSNVRRVKFLKVVCKNYGSTGRVGDVFVGVVHKLKQARGKFSLKRGQVINCIIVGTSKEFQNNLRKTGVFVKSFPRNSSGVLLKNFNKEKNSYVFQGSRVFGPLSNVLLQKKHFKFRNIGEFFFV